MYTQKFLTCIHTANSTHYPYYHTHQLHLAISHPLAPPMSHLRTINYYHYNYTYSTYYPYQLHLYHTDYHYQHYNRNPLTITIGSTYSSLPAPLTYHLTTTTVYLQSQQYNYCTFQSNESSATQLTQNAVRCLLCVPQQESTAPSHCGQTAATHQEEKFIKRGRKQRYYTIDMYRIQHTNYYVGYEPINLRVYGYPPSNEWIIRGT